MNRSHSGIFALALTFTLTAWPTGDATAVPVFDPCFDGCMTLNPGSNLVSFRRLPANASIATVFGDVASNIVAIQGDGVFAIRLLDGTFAGNATTLERTRGYRVTTDLAAPADVPFMGEETDPDLQYNLRQGKSLVSFSCGVEIPIESAFHPEDLGKVLDIQAQGKVAKKLPNSWAGTLKTLEPNKGYWVNVSEAIPHFRFNCPLADGKEDYVYGCTNGAAQNHDGSATIDNGTCKYKSPADWTYAHDADQSHYLLHDIRVGADSLPLTKKDLIAVFGPGDKLLGYGTTSGPYATVTAFGVQPEDTLTFVVYRVNSGELVPLKTTPAKLVKEPGIGLGGCGIKAADNYFPDAMFGIGNCVVTSTCAGKGAGDGCDDGSECTLSDLCTAAGLCVGSGAGCVDDNPCTENECLVDGDCGLFYVEGGCDDGDPCTEADLCIAGQCGGKAKECADGEICVDGNCEAGVADPDPGDVNEDVSEPDAETDAGPDATPDTASPGDASESDGGTDDTTTGDTAASDSASPDTGAPSADTGASSSDTGAPTVDATPAVDTGGSSGDPDDGGCASAPASRAGWGLFLLFCLCLLRRRAARAI